MTMEISYAPKRLGATRFCAQMAGAECESDSKV